MADPKPDEERSKQKNGMPSWVFALVGGAAYLLFGVLLVLLLDWYINPGDSTENKKDLVQALALIMAGVAGAIGVYFTWRGQRLTQKAQADNQRSTQEQLKNAQEQLRLARLSQEENQQATRAQLENAQEELRLTREGQITERFTRAINQLGARDFERTKNLEMRLGGIYALERIAKESPEDYWPVVEILTAYVREHASRGSRAEDQPPSPDIQAILTALGRRSPYSAELAEAGRINLNNTDLQSTDLEGADLRGANLQGANLPGANEQLTYTLSLQGATMPDGSKHP